MCGGIRVQQSQWVALTNISPYTGTKCELNPKIIVLKTISILPKALNNFYKVVVSWETNNLNSKHHNPTYNVWKWYDLILSFTMHCVCESSRFVTEKGTIAR